MTSAERIYVKLADESDVVVVDQSGDGTSYWLWCPACDEPVRINDT